MMGTFGTIEHKTKTSKWRPTERPRLRNMERIISVHFAIKKNVDGSGEGWRKNELYTQNDIHLVESDTIGVLWMSMVIGDLVAEALVYSLFYFRWEPNGYLRQ